MFGDLLAHCGALLAIAALLERIANLLLEEFFRLNTEHLREFLGGARCDAFGLADGVSHGDGLAAKFLALMTVGSLGGNRDGVAGLLAQQRLVEAFDH